LPLPAPQPPAPEPPAPEPLSDASAAAEAPEQALLAPSEVVVTVDRRRKNLQDYSGTAAAFSESQLSSLGVANVRDLPVMVPGLQIGTQESGTNIYIRGIGSDNNTELGDPAVALHVDGVYMPRARGVSAMFFDIARVEVNSGPQGTLRGRNATGGSINIITNQPNLDEVQANAQATFGNYSERAYEGMLNLPVVSGKLGLRVAAKSETHDPYWENAGPLYDLRGAQDANDYALRVTAKYRPMPALELTIAYDFTHEGGTGTIGANFNAALNRVDDAGTPLDTTDDSIIPFDPADVSNPRRIYERGIQPSARLNHQGIRAAATLDAGPVLFEALASYRDLDFKQFNGSSAGAVVPGIDISGINPDNWGGSNQREGKSKSTIAELRAYAPDDQRLRWTVGGFFFYEKQSTFLGQVTDPVAAAGGAEFDMPSTIGWSGAGYADATFDVASALRVLGGLRVTKEHKDREGGFWGVWNGLPPNGSIPAISNPNASLGRFGTEGFEYKGFARPNLSRASDSVEDRVNLFLDGIRSFGARDEVPLALCNDPPAAAAGEPANPRIALNDEGNFRCQNGIRPEVEAAPNIFSVTPQNNHVDNTFVDYRVGLEYDVGADHLLYATFSTGHKAAGFNDTQSFANVPLFNSEYGPEALYAVELGSKNVLLDRALRLNGAAFYYAYSGMQFQTIVPVEKDPDPTDNVGPPGSAVRQNAAETTQVFGADIDGTLRLPAGLEAQLHVLLMDARFSDGTYVNDSRLSLGSNSNAQVDLGGNWLPRASPATLNYQLSQLIFSAAGSFDWMIQGQTRGTHYFTVYNGDGTRLVKPGPDFLVAPADMAAYQAAVNNLQRFNDVQRTYTVFNVGAGWKHPDGRLSVSAFVNNVFNITYANTIISTNAINNRYYNNQRLAGVRVRVDW
jgi:iron complex outermembrane receptor protein